MEFTIPQRLSITSGGINLSMHLDEVSPLGLHRCVERFTEDFYSDSGVVNKRDVTSIMKPILRSISHDADSYGVYVTPNSQIKLLANKEVSESYLLEVFTVSFIVDVYEQIYQIKKRSHLAESFLIRQFFYQLDGKNNLNNTNVMFDSKYGAFIGRIDSRLSNPFEDSYLACDPVDAIARKCMVSTEPIGGMEGLHDRARILAYKYLRETFFLD